jgi:amino acid adenylation domain-containing protein
VALFDRFLLQCTAAPERVAFIQGDRFLTYREVDREARGIAAVLEERSIRPGDRVAIALDRGIDAVLSIYATLYLGACYVPLDIKNPTARLLAIVQDALPRAIIGAGGRPDWVIGDIDWLDVDRLAEPRSSLVPRAVAAEAPAAILYTSGSSGAPKGIALSHRAMATFSDWAGTAFSVAPEDRIAGLAPFYFDLSVFDLFTSLRYGAVVDFVPIALTLAPSRLSAWLDARQITCWYTVPSILAFLAFKGKLAERPLANLTRILFAGDVFPTPQLIKLAGLLPNVNLFNLYGPTETNVCCYWPVDRARLDPEQPIPIGLPACGARLRIDGANGELLVKGPSLMSGYWKQGGLERGFDTTGWYRTGDRVSRNEAGELLYHGRLDRMLKCSGYRVEPAEIEALVCRFPGVEQCAVVGIADSAGGRRPAAAIVFDGEPDLPGLAQALRHRLPLYMQPARLVPYDYLPCLPNGKVDYKSLEKMLLGEPLGND